MKIDFSQNAINREVKRSILQNPLSVYSVIFGIVGLFLFTELISAPVLLVLSIAGVIGGLLLTVINFFLRKNTFENRYVAKLNHFLGLEQKKVFKRLTKELEGFSAVKELKIFASQAVSQFEMVERRFANFKRLLQDKFDSGEITYARFLGTAEQLYLSVLDNLESVLNYLEAVKNIDDKYIEERLKYLENLKNPEEADLREIKTLGIRKEVKVKQLEKLNDLLTLNEEAMTQIDLSMVAVSALKTKSGRATMDIEPAREELEELIRRIKKYSSSENETTGSKPVINSLEEEVLRSRNRE